MEIHYMHHRRMWCIDDDSSYTSNSKFILILSLSVRTRYCCWSIARKSSSSPPMLLLRWMNEWRSTNKRLFLYCSSSCFHMLRHLLHLFPLLLMMKLMYVDTCECRALVLKALSRHHYQRQGRTRFLCCFATEWIPIFINLSKWSPGGRGGGGERIISQPSTINLVKEHTTKRRLTDTQPSLIIIIIARRYNYFMDNGLCGGMRVQYPSGWQRSSGSL